MEQTSHRLPKDVTTAEIPTSLPESRQSQDESFGKAPSDLQATTVNEHVSDTAQPAILLMGVTGTGKSSFAAKATSTDAGSRCTSQTGTPFRSLLH